MAPKACARLPIPRLIRPTASLKITLNSTRCYSAFRSLVIPPPKTKYIPTSGTYPKGFLVSGTHVGVKPTNKTTPDLAFLASETPCAAAAVFTKNKFQAAPVTLSRSMLQRRQNAGIRSVIVNSGCANAVTGKGGLEDAEKMGAEADKCFGAPDDGKGGSTIVMSTGAVDLSFNSISIDGDTSTNDTVALLANGAAGGKEIDSESSEDYAVFQHTLTEFARDLAKLIVRDGEGATKFVTIRVVDAPSVIGARKVASTIAKSPLVKTALYGKDANWGRILCATGYSQITEPGMPINATEIIPEKTSVSFIPPDGTEELKLLVNGEPEIVDEARAAEILEHEDIEIVVSLGIGTKEAIYWTCDFSHEYVTINGDYRT
ncbi:Arginine biosynthesis bifunctional mitochondrial protein [Rutstroemia sp. NJR-2017a WRK4]|nr:Arginine biosynthesis bifunctional mitochondrial protein [Rutstroemia sp. NJR-2017a WRK4]